MRLEKFWDDLRASLLFRPALWVAGLGLLAVILIAVEEHWPQNFSHTFLQWLFSSSVEADAVRIILGTISGAIVTATTLAFSIVIVAVVQTANAYSPRILRLYVSDTTNQHVLGILIGTFLFSLLVLRAVRSPDEEGTFIPTLALSAAILLALVSLAAFIYFIDHVVHSIEVDNVISLIMHDTAGMFDDLFPITLGQPWTAEMPPSLPVESPAQIIATHSGYLQYIDPDALLAAAIKYQRLIRIERQIGDYILSGTPLVRVWPEGPPDKTLAKIVCDVFSLGTERTMVQDLFFGVRQLSDIALRAISPAVNDPSTAVNAIDAMSTMLVKMVQLPPISPYRCDEAGHLRVIAFGPNFESMLDLAFNQVRQYAAGDYACTIRLIDVCSEIAYVAQQPADQAALWRHIGMIARGAARNFAEPHDRAEINRHLLTAATLMQQDAAPFLLQVDRADEAC